MRILLLLTFLESFAVICVERGAYFFTTHRLGFSDGKNLWLALVFGATYVLGALVSHRVCRRLGEKKILMAVLLCQVAGNMALAEFPSVLTMFIFCPFVSLLNGMKWPVVESYVSAGQSPGQQARSVGVFNLSWSIAVPLSLLVTGPLIDRWPAWLFRLPAICNVVTVLMAATLAGRPVHLPASHELRLPPEQVRRWAALLTSNRWLMFASYSAMFLMAPLMPGIFEGLGVAKTVSPALSALMDVMRVGAFVALGLWVGWHGKVSPIWASVLGMMAGLFMILFPGQIARALGHPEALGVPVALVGQVIFGLAAGTIYYAALYYAMVVQNASVEGGGTHESLIGLGFAVGPLIGLVAMWLETMLHDKILATTVGMSPVLILCAVMGGLPLFRTRRTAQADSTSVER